MASSQTDSWSEKERPSSYNGTSNDRISPNETVENGDIRHQHEDEETLLEKDMIENHVPESLSNPDFGRASFWIVVNTLATIGIVGSPSVSPK
jgi:solute carrier family 35 protein E3